MIRTKYPILYHYVYTTFTHSIIKSAPPPPPPSPSGSYKKLVFKDHPKNVDQKSQSKRRKMLLTNQSTRYRWTKTSIFWRIFTKTGNPISSLPNFSLVFQAVYYRPVYRKIKGPHFRVFRLKTLLGRNTSLPAFIPVWMINNFILRWDPIAPPPYLPFLTPPSSPLTIWAFFHRPRTPKLFLELGSMSS